MLIKRLNSWRSIQKPSSDWLQRGFFPPCGSENCGDFALLYWTRGLNLNYICLATRALTRKERNESGTVSKRKCCFGQENEQVAVSLARKSQRSRHPPFGDHRDEGTVSKQGSSEKVPSCRTDAAKDQPHAGASKRIALWYGD